MSSGNVRKLSGPIRNRTYFQCTNMPETPVSTPKFVAGRVVFHPQYNTRRDTLLLRRCIISSYIDNRAICFFLINEHENDALFPCTPVYKLELGRKRCCLLLYCGLFRHTTRLPNSHARCCHRARFSSWWHTTLLPQLTRTVVITVTPLFHPK